MKRSIEIKSIFSGKTWQGELALPSDDLDALKIISRFFSRVDPEDGQRLDEIGYRLPSISVGDRVTIDGQRYWANAVGWSSSWADLPAYARAMSQFRHD